MWLIRDLSGYEIKVSGEGGGGGNDVGGSIIKMKRLSLKSQRYHMLDFAFQPGLKFDCDISAHTQPGVEFNEGRLKSRSSPPPLFGLKFAI